MTAEKPYRDSPFDPRPARLAPILPVGCRRACSGSAGSSTMRTGRRSSRSSRCSKTEFDLSNTPARRAGLGVHAGLRAVVAVHGLHGRPAVAPAVDHAGPGVLEPDLRGHGRSRGTSLQLIFFRAAEGLGESFYFPASMSFLADYHRPRTRSRALSIHQTSVYLGTAGGAVLGGFLGERHGWRSPFWMLGLAGIALRRSCSGSRLIEPARESSEGQKVEAGPRGRRGLGPTRPRRPNRSTRQGSGGSCATLRRPCSWCVFVGANFVAATFLTWLPTLHLRAVRSGTGRVRHSHRRSGRWPVFPGRFCGGVAADWAARRRRGGRIRVQSLGLLLAAPFVFLTGWSTSVPVLIAGLIGAGLCKGDLRLEYLRLTFRRDPARRPRNRGRV